MNCLDSGEIFELAPYIYVDPPYQLELRQLMLYALTKANVKVPVQSKLQVLEAQMRPRSVEEVEVVEKQLYGALEELKQLRKHIQASGVEYKAT
ncbi:MAG: hypothetical protein ACLPXM_01895 [Terriglobales bacterium]